MVLDLGGSRYNSPALSATDPETVQAYEWRERLLQWPIIPEDATVEAIISTKIETGSGITIRPQIWDVTGTPVLAFDGADSTATTFTEQTIAMPRLVTPVNKLYELRAKVTGGDAGEAVWFFGVIRVTFA